MKTFKKLALVSAIAAAPFAAQAMEALDDSVLGNTTGQAGVTIDLSIGDAGVTIGSVTYTDTVGEVSPGVSDNHGGQVVLENISIKNITGLKQTIDVAGTGDLLMTMGGATVLTQTSIDANGDVVNGANLGSGDVLGVAGIEISVGGSTATSAVMLQGKNASDEVNQAELVDHLNMNVDLGASTTTIYNLANAPTFAGTLEAAGVTGARKTESASMAIAMNSSFRLNNMNVGVFGYTEDQANVKAGLAVGTDIDANLATMTSTYNGTQTALTDLAGVTSATYNADGTVDQVDVGAGLVDTTDGSVTGLAGATAAIGDVDTASTGYGQARLAYGTANGSAIEISGLTFKALDGGMVSASQVIWADAAGVNIQMGAIRGNLNIGSIAIGGKSIGSVAIADLNLAGMTQTIYGH